MATLSLTGKEQRPRRWRVWIPMRDENVAIDADGPEAWVKGGHLFVGPSKASQDWTLAWAPGGWLSIELMEGPD